MQVVKSLYRPGLSSRAGQDGVAGEEVAVAQGVAGGTLLRACDVPNHRDNAF